MSIIEEKLNIEQQFNKLKEELQILLKLNYNVDLINQLICLCNTYNTLSVTEIQESEQVINKAYELIKSNTKLLIEYKGQLLTILKKLKKLINNLIVSTIINSI